MKNPRPEDQKLVDQLNLVSVTKEDIIRLQRALLEEHKGSDDVDATLTAIRLFGDDRGSLSWPNRKVGR